MTQKITLSSSHDIAFSKPLLSQANAARRAPLIKALATCVLRHPSMSDEIDQNDL